MRSRLSVVALLLISSSCAPGRQRADQEFVAEVIHPTYSKGEGPHVFVDEAHFNFHTESGRYKAFADVLRADGYQVSPWLYPFTEERLRPLSLLVIANALHEQNRYREEGESNWSLPTLSAFTNEEIDAIASWVSDGGSLMLVVDHMPLPGAASTLANAFGFELMNGFAIDEGLEEANGDIRAAMRHGLHFRKEDGTLADHAITRATSGSAPISEVVSFTGHAFWGDEDTEPLMTLGPRVVSLMPEVAWEFDENTQRITSAFALQGAVKNFGHGRIAIFGEAAMFTAQRTGDDRSIGLSSPMAPQNQQFLINVFRWLSRLIPLSTTRP